MACLPASDDLGAVLALVRGDTADAVDLEDVLDGLLVPRSGALWVLVQEEPALTDLIHVLKLLLVAFFFVLLPCGNLR